MFGWETIQTLAQYARAVGITPLVRATDFPIRSSPGRSMPARSA